MIVVKLKEAMASYHRRTGTRITYESLAERAGLSRATVEALGSRSEYNTTLRTLDQLCTALGCEVSDLIEWKPGTRDDAAEPVNDR